MVVKTGLTYGIAYNVNTDQESCIMPNKKPAGLVLEPTEQATVTEVVAQRLIAQLSNGVLKPGDKLPAERESAQ